MLKRYRINLKVACGVISTTGLHNVMLKYETYHMDTKHTMTRRLRILLVMISDLKATVNNISD